MIVNFDFPRTVDQLVDDFFVSADFVGGSRYATFPVLDVVEYDKECVVVAEMPDVKKENLKLTVENGRLTISGERKPSEIPKDARVLLSERKVQDFSRTIRLPRGVDANNISAELQNGMLRIVLPKSEDVRVRTIAIK